MSSILAKFVSLKSYPLEPFPYWLSADVQPVSSVAQNSWKMVDFMVSIFRFTAERITETITSQTGTGFYSSVIESTLLGNADRRILQLICEFSSRSALWLHLVVLVFVSHVWPYLSTCTNGHSASSIPPVPLRHRAHQACGWRVQQVLHEAAGETGVGDDRGGLETAAGPLTAVVGGMNNIYLLFANLSGHSLDKNC